MWKRVPDKVRREIVNLALDEPTLSPRRINDGMGAHVADRVAKLMMKRDFPVVGSRILVMGWPSRRNCPDMKNSKVIDLIHGPEQYNARIEVWDLWLDHDEERHEFGLETEAGEPDAGCYDAIVMAVGHREFAILGADKVHNVGQPGAVFFDVKGIFAKTDSDGRL